MPGQQRRGGPRPTPGVRRPDLRAGNPGRTSTEPAGQPRPTRLGTPVGGSLRTGSGRSGTSRVGAGRAKASQARAGARPAVARRPATTGAAQRTRTAQPNRFTGRATVLALVLGALLLAYAYPVRIYLNQQSEIDALREHQRQQQTRIAGLQAESQKWNDPSYVESQACSRLHMCRPGDTLYIVVGGDAQAGTGSAAADAKSTDPWYDQLWSSVTAADQPGK